MSTVRQDVEQSLRHWLSSPLSSVAALAALVLAIGGITTVYSLVDRLLLASPPGLVEPDLLLELGRSSNGVELDTVSYPDFKAIAEQSTTLAEVFGWRLAPLNVRIGGEPERAFGSMVSGNYFQAMRVMPFEGRMLTPNDDKTAGAHPVAVASHRAWVQRFGGDPSAIGKTFVLNAHRYTLIGVTPPDFQGHIAILSPDFYVPLSMLGQIQPGREKDLVSRSARWLLIGARRKSEASLEAVRAELDAIWTRLAPLQSTRDQASGRPLDRLGAMPLKALPNQVGGVIAVGASLLGLLLVLVLVVACTNVAGILLARGEQRSGELGLRLALGARQWHIWRQLLLESFLMAVAAALGGIMVARAGLAALKFDALPLPFPIVADFGITTGSWLFAAAIAGMVVLFCGLVPAWRASRISPRTALSESTSAITGTRSRMRESLVITQIAITTFLLAAAILSMRALIAVTTVSSSFHFDDIYTADLDMQPTGYTADQQQILMASLLDDLRARPGINAAGSAQTIPLSGNLMELGEFEDERLPENVRYPQANTVSPGYFGTIQLALRGRDFAYMDKADSQPVAIVNETLARALFGAVDAVGQVVRFDGLSTHDVLVIGVVADSKYRSLDEAPTPFIYLPTTQYRQPEMNLFIRSKLSQNEVQKILWDSVKRIDPNLPKSNLHSMSYVLALSLMPRRVIGWVALVLGLLGGLISIIGVYGLTAYYVAKRRREIGLRLAMGATAKIVRQQIRGCSLRLASWGVGIGAAGCALLLLALSSALPGAVVGATSSVFAATVAMLFVSWLSGERPAREASSITPMLALRHE